MKTKEQIKNDLRKTLGEDLPDSVLEDILSVMNQPKHDDDDITKYLDPSK